MCFIFGKFAFVHSLFSDKETFLAISFDSHFVLLNLHGLVNIEFKDLDEACECVLLRAFEV